VSDRNGNRDELSLVQPAAGRRAFGVVAAVCAVVALADLVYHKHVHHDWEGWFSFHGLYGYVGCFVLVLAARVLRKIVMRDEDYYGR